MAGKAGARETIYALRRDIARIEGRLAERLVLPTDERGGDGDGEEARLLLRRHGMAQETGLLSLGSATLDEALNGGLPHAALTELHSGETRDAGALAGFALGLAAMTRAGTGAPLIWVAAGDMFREGGEPYAPGILERFGIPPGALLVARTRELRDALWIAEEAAALSTISAVLVELRGASRTLDLTATRRLHRRTQAAGRPLYLLRHAGLPEPTAAPVRLVVEPAPSSERRLLSGTLAGSIGPPAFTVSISRSRHAVPATAILEWNAHERAFHERQPAANVVLPQDHGAVVSLSGHRANSPRQAGARLAFDGAA